MNSILGNSNRTKMCEMGEERIDLLQIGPE